MKILKYVSVFIVVLSLGCLYSCNRGEKVKINISDPNIALPDLASKVYSDSQLLEIANFDGSLNELNDKFPVECLRLDQKIYRASYLGENKIVVVFFDNSGNKLRGNIYNTNKSKSDFGELKISSSLKDVKFIDPDGEYLFLYTGRNDIPRVSSHYTKDGYLITVEYDFNDNIANIRESLI